MDRQNPLGYLSGKRLCALKAALLFGLLLFHFQARQQTARTMPGKCDEFYRPASGYLQGYRVSLSLLAGQGFRRLALPGEAGDPPTDTQILRGTRQSDSVDHLPVSEAQPIVEFLNSRRSKLSQEDFEAYLCASGAATQPCDALDTARILDIYVTASFWKVFGISWNVYYGYTSLASTGACLLIFFIARRLAGSYWAGFFAALLFCASPFETHFAIRSLRDISPLWFATLAFAFFVCRLDQFQSKKLNLLSFFLMGVLAMLGRGWRVDVLLLVPFFVSAMVVLLYFHRRGWKYALVGCSLFLAGAWAADSCIRGLCPGERQGSESGYHVAYYGDASRCNLMGLENSFQISRDDVQTYHTACLYNEAIGGGESLRYVSLEYGRACKNLLAASLKYHLYQYIKFWPKFYWQALALVNASRLSWAKPAYQWCLDYLTKWLPCLHLLGIATLCWMGRDKIRGAILVAFGFYYSVFLFLVLPEHKHLGQLLLPLTVTGGIGLWGLCRLIRFLFFSLDIRELQTVVPRSVRIAMWASVAACGCWALACLVSHAYSVRQRARYLNEIRALTAKAPDACDKIKDRRVFSTYLTDEEPAVGYLLTIQAAANSGYLTCRHVHFPSTSIPGRVLVTHHKLQPGQLQYFAVSCLRASKYGDHRPYACSVMLPAGASIVGCRELDLSNWKRLPFSTVFCDGDSFAGSPPVDRVPYSALPTDPYFAKYFFNNFSSEIAYDYPWELISVAGLPFYQNLEYPGLRPMPLVADVGNGGDGQLRPPTNLEEGSRSGLPLGLLREEPGVGCEGQVDGVHLKSSPGHAGQLASYPTMTVNQEGAILVKVKYRQVGHADLQLRAVQTDGNDIPKQRCLPSTEAESVVKFLEIWLRRGDSFQLQLINSIPGGTDESEIVVQEIQAYREKNPLWRAEEVRAE